MELSQIQKGHIYATKVSNRVVPVRVDRIRETTKYQYSSFGPGRNVNCTVFECTNLTTQRRITVRSAQRFRYLLNQKDGTPWQPA